jgi:hypothetical protein
MGGWIKWRASDGHAAVLMSTESDALDLQTKFIQTPKT